MLIRTKFTVTMVFGKGSSSIFKCSIVLDNDWKKQNEIRSSPFTNWNTNKEISPVHCHFSPHSLPYHKQPWARQNPHHVVSSPANSSINWMKYCPDILKTNRYSWTYLIARVVHAADGGVTVEPGSVRATHSNPSARLSFAEIPLFSIFFWMTHWRSGTLYVIREHELEPISPLLWVTPVPAMCFIMCFRDIIYFDYSWDCEI